MLDLQTLVTEIALTERLDANQTSIAIVNLDHPGEIASFGGDTTYYPASVVKLYFLIYLAHLLDAGNLALTDEITRACNDMIIDSSNDATALILDVITGTTGGTELAAEELAAWMERRQAVNHHLRKLGLTANACQKTWNEGPYGRERQGYGANLELRNTCTPLDALRLMTMIMNDQLKGCQWMKTILSRSIPADDPNAGQQAREFIGASLPSGTSLWSKAGYTSEVRHDVAAFQLPNGRQYALSIFTRGNSDNLNLIPHLAAIVVSRLISE